MSMANICEFGTAPEQSAEGYIGFGIEICGTDEEVLRIFRFQDVRLVRGPHAYGTPNDFMFYPMFKANKTGDALSVDSMTCAKNLMIKAISKLQAQCVRSQNESVLDELCKYKWHLIEDLFDLPSEDQLPDFAE